VSEIFVTGVGAVGPSGLGLPESLESTAAGRFRLVPPDLPLKEGFPAPAMRWLDASSLWWLNAARQAAGPAGTGPEGALVVGLGWGSNPPVIALLEQSHQEGFASMAPAQFPYSVGNAPAAQAGILLGMRGAAITLCAKEAAGLAALAEACRYLRAGMFDRCVAGGVDQADPTLRRVVGELRRGDGVPAGEGAYALRLDRAVAAPEGALARVAGWAACSAPAVPHRFPAPGPLLDRTLQKLLGRAGWEASTVDLAALPGDSPALRAASEEVLCSNLRSAAPLVFQPALGACGASWAGAAGLAAAKIAGGGARRAVLVAIATGGCSWGLALEAAHAQ
jgi:hypothetical protein